jgi:hypothetical protein
MIEEVRSNLRATEFGNNLGSKGHCRSQIGIPTNAKAFEPNRSHTEPDLPHLGKSMVVSTSTQVPEVSDKNRLSSLLARPKRCCSWHCDRADGRGAPKGCSLVCARASH